MAVGIRDALRDIRDTTGFVRHSNHWPAYQPAPSPAGEFWDDLSDHREQLLDMIESAWKVFVDPVDGAVILMEHKRMMKLRRRRCRGST